jgi:ribosomal protein L11 methyltransferase
MPEGFWTEVTLRVRPEASEAVAELLQDFTGAGVSIEPPIEALGPDEGYVLDETAPLTLHGYMYGEVADERRAELEESLDEAGHSSQLVGDLRWRTIREEDWAEAWKEHYQVERAGRVVVRPAWREYEASGDEVVVTLDPGMAFGTGQHPTTKMALLALQELIEPGAHVLDLGAGSGVLALAAIALGARDAVAIDTEMQAYEASLSNAALNDMSNRIEAVHGSIEQAANRTPFDLVLANINAATIIRLAPALYEALRPGQYLVAGGIIEEREAACREALEAAGFAVERTLSDGDWRCLICRR